MQSSRLTESIRIKDDITVTVPASPRLMTPFVLREQHDWFEDEIGFIRSYIRPGMKVVDIGASYGLYTLTIARIVGDSGKVWAFEPTEATAACLNKSITLNNFSNIELVQRGLSDRQGDARLYTSPDSEANTLTKEAATGDHHEIIGLLTLDQCRQEYGWEYIDFIKLDAEGEEYNILKKGKTTLSSLSPLVMLELKHGDNINLPVMKQFGQLGYGFYRLVPGLNILIPFDHKETYDKYLLNVFCCKAGLANHLEQQGVISRHRDTNCVTGNTPARDYIASLAFGKSLNHTAVSANSNIDQDYSKILNAYILSLSGSESSSARVGYLLDSLDMMKGMLDSGEQGVERLATFARIAFDAGERALGVRILSDAIRKYTTVKRLEIKDLFLPACQRYDTVNPGNRINEWLFSSILEQCIVKHAYSSYFTGPAALPLFKLLRRLGFINEDMRRRYRLVKACYS